MNAHAAATLYARAPLACARRRDQLITTPACACGCTLTARICGPARSPGFGRRSCRVAHGSSRCSWRLRQELGVRRSGGPQPAHQCQDEHQDLFGASWEEWSFSRSSTTRASNRMPSDFMSDPNETVVYRQNADQAASLQREAMRRGLMQRGSMSHRIDRNGISSPSSVEDEGEPSADEAEENVSLFQRVVRTIKFTNTTDVDAPGAMTRVGAFIAFPGKQASQPATSDANEWPAVRQQKGAANMDEVDRYLWEVYQRAPIKKDRSGDFTWKDPAAAKRMDMSLPEYVIGGMDPDFREQLYHAGQAMDAAGIQWSCSAHSVTIIVKASPRDTRPGSESRCTAAAGRREAMATAALSISQRRWRAEYRLEWIDANGANSVFIRPIPGRSGAHPIARRLAQARLSCERPVCAPTRSKRPRKARRASQGRRQGILSNAIAAACVSAVASAPATPGLREGSASTRISLYSTPVAPIARMIDQPEPHKPFIVIRGEGASDAALRGAVVAIGNFDGVHRGHRTVIAAAIERARELHRPAAALTFEPHPRVFFHPQETCSGSRTSGRSYGCSPQPGSMARLYCLSMRPWPVFLGGGSYRACCRHVLRSAGSASALTFISAPSARERRIISTRREPDFGFTVDVGAALRACRTGGALGPDPRRAWRGGSPRRMSSLASLVRQRRGRARRQAWAQLGYPTANLRLDPGCGLAHGIYAVRVESTAPLRRGGELRPAPDILRGRRSARSVPVRFFRRPLRQRR